MSNFRELKVWQKSMDLSVTVYKITDTFPKQEIYGITAQMRRAAVSIVSNVAEGAGRNSNRDFYRFLSIAKGSAYELETQLMISQRLAFIKNSVAENLLNDLVEIQKMISGLQKSL